MTDPVLAPPLGGQDSAAVDSVSVLRRMTLELSHQVSDPGWGDQPGAPVSPGGALWRWERGSANEAVTVRRGRRVRVGRREQREGAYPHRRSFPVLPYPLGCTAGHTQLICDGFTGCSLGVC